MPKLITMLTANGAVCCASDDPAHFCRRCTEAYRRGGTRNKIVTNENPDSRRETMRPGDATLAYMRSREAHLSTRGPIQNCACNHGGDALPQHTMNDVAGIATPTTNSSMPNPGELVYNGLCDSDDAMVMPTLNYDRLACNVTGSAAALSKGHTVPGGKGYLTASARDAVRIPGFDVIDAMNRHYPDGDTGAYPTTGYRAIPPNYGPTSEADVQDDDEASAGLGYDRGGRPIGRGASHGRPSMTEVAQYGNAPPVEDRTEQQRGVVRTGGQSIYAADFFRRQLPGQLGVGANPLPGDYDGQDYQRSPTQDQDNSTRQFGQQKRNPTANREEDQLVAPTIDWRHLSAELRRTGR